MAELICKKNPHLKECDGTYYYRCSVCDYKFECEEEDKDWSGTCEDCENQEDTECVYCGDTFDPEESGEELRCEECITNDRQVCDDCDAQCEGCEEYVIIKKNNILKCIDCFENYCKNK